MKTRQPDIALTPAIKWGNIGGGGTGVVTDPGSGDWYVTRTSVGVYVVTFTKPFANIPVVVCTSHYGGGGIIAATVQARSATSFTVNVCNSAGSIDSNVEFVALGSVK